VSSLWTPEGEHRVPPPTPSGPPGGTPSGGRDRPPSPPADDVTDIDDLSPEEREALAARLDDLRHQLAETPAEVVIANHAYGLFELAAIHLSQQPPSLESARLAVDALGALVSGLEGRLGQAEPSLKDALSQIRMTFVKISQSGNGGTEDAPGPQPDPA
jgi:hypothetical protein